MNVCASFLCARFYVLEPIEILLLQNALSKTHIIILSLDSYHFTFLFFSHFKFSKRKAAKRFTEEENNNNDGCCCCYFLRLLLRGALPR